jgi:HK97 family phage prohead protease
VTHVVERRFVTSEFEVRQLSTGGVQIEGHAAVFNRFSQDLGGFVEQVAPGAFAKTIQEADVRALYNHDPSMVLGRNKSGTLDLSEDNIGLHYRVKLPDTTYARDLAISMERGDVSQSSFGFRVIPGGDEWSFTEQDYPLRTLRELQLMDVSPVTYPAYLDADSGIAGRAIDGLAAAKGYALEAVQADLRAAIAGTLNTAQAPAETTSGNEDLLRTLFGKRLTPGR